MQFFDDGVADSTSTTSRCFFRRRRAQASYCYASKARRDRVYVRSVVRMHVLH